MFGFDFENGFNLGNIVFEKNQLIYLLSLTICIFAGLGVKNLTRSKTGRAFSAIRDGDIAAEAIGVSLYKFKSFAFALSSFYAGVAGSLLFSVSGGVDPGTFNFLFNYIYCNCYYWRRWNGFRATFWSSLLHFISRSNSNNYAFFRRFRTKLSFINWSN